MSRHVLKKVHGTKLYEEALKRIAELEADCEKAWTAYDQILKDRNALLDQLNKGPLSSEEWQIRAIRAEAERDQLAARLETARKALEQMKITADDIWRNQQRSTQSVASGLLDLIVKSVDDALAQISNPSAAQKGEECATCDTAGRCTYVCEQPKTKPIEQVARSEAWKE